MYAIFETGGKQYSASVGDVVRVEKLDSEVGTKLELKALMIVDGESVNTKGGAVVCEVVEHGKGEKVVVYKYKAKKNYRRKQGHRQPFTAVKVLEIK